MSFCPSEIGAAIQQRKPDFKLDYDIDPMKQAIADSWPNSLDDSCAREEWDWNPKYDLEQMTDDMLGRLEIEYEKK
jgi:nucleoside-diphosphate-sugar epimerase